MKPANATPSTEKQWDLANKLKEELQAMGMQEVSIDENAYVMATFHQMLIMMSLLLVLFHTLIPLQIFPEQM